MPRQIEMTLSPDSTDELLEQFQKIEGVSSLSAQRGGSIKPEGDIVRLSVSNAALHEVMRQLKSRSLEDHPDFSMTTSTVLSSVSAGKGKAQRTDRSEMAWEEIEELIGRQSNTTANALIVMAIAGVLAAVGIATATLHYLIAAMLIAPGFMPLTRVALGFVANSKVWQRGLLDFVKAYLVIILAAGLTIVLLGAFGAPGLSWEDSYLTDQVLVNFWLEITLTALLVSFVGALAGNILVVTNRSVLTGGAMIALSLVPSAAMIGIFIVMGDAGLAGQAFVRWLVDVAIVIGTGLLVMAWKRASVHQRDMMG